MDLLLHAHRRLSGAGGLGCFSNLQQRVVYDFKFFATFVATIRSVSGFGGLHSCGQWERTDRGKGDIAGDGEYSLSKSDHRILN